MIETPFNYTGSKFKLLPQLLPLFPKMDNFVDLFCGGGSIYTNVLHSYKTIYVNDIIPELISIHRELHEGDTIIDRTKALCVSRTDEDGYYRLRVRFNKERLPEQLWALMLCCTNNMMRFNRKFEFNQTFGKRTWNSETDRKVNGFTERVRNFNNIIYSSKSFRNFPIMENSFYYIDPPYSNTLAGYNAFWGKDDDEWLYSYCKKIDGAKSKFMVSGVLNHDGEKCKLLELLKQQYQLVTLHGDYNKVSRKGEKETQEIVIKNF